MKIGTISVFTILNVSQFICLVISQSIPKYWRAGSISRVGALLQEKVIRNMYQCENLCKVTNPCLAVSYSVRTRMCSLFREVPVDENISPSTSDIRISDIRRTPEGDCKQRCQSGLACVQNGNESLCHLAGISCGRPPVVLHADVTSEAMTYNTSLTYICHLGYRSEGSSLTTRCTEDGSWSLLTSSCTIISCGQPLGIAKGRIDYPATVYGSTATYTCDKDYFFEGGDPVTTCTAAGVWAPVSGSCEKQYRGCYTDDSDRMLKLGPFNSKSMTVELCLKTCKAKKKKYAAVEYSSQCFCGDSWDSVKYPRVSDTSCNRRCSGNTTQVCGGSWLLSLYGVA